jgi:uncharacterized membrane protein
MTSRSDTDHSEQPTRSRYPLRWLVVSLALLVGLGFVIATPPGLLSKADMVAYAVCHRITSHSFAISGRQLPLCARCTGTFTGAVVGLLGQAFVLRRRRTSGFPPAYIIVILVGFIALMAADGLNSYLTLFPLLAHLYEPQNWLRLTTGAFNGLAMSGLVYPVFNFTLWRRPLPHRAIANLRDLGILMLLEIAMVALVLTGWPILLYPVALLSASGVLTLLTFVNTMIVVMIGRRENQYDSWRRAVLPVLLGFTVSLIQIGVIDILRYALTGTLQGIPPLQ